jgi:SAM-dependent methyltransferase
MSASQLSVCRSCGGENLVKVLSFGSTPLANSLLTASQLNAEEAKYPLELVFCRSCTLVQITETVPAETLFRHYLYFSSFSDTMLNHVRELAERLIKSRQLNGDSLVMEIASNDGYLLQNYKAAGISVLGIEPAVNIARVAAEQRAIPTICDFFGESLAKELSSRGTTADIMHAHNVLAHVDDLNGFVRGVAYVLKDDGIAVIEVPYVKDMIDHCEFDTIYHEHLCYFSLMSLDNLFRRHGLIIDDVDRTSLHGGSLQISVQKVVAGKKIRESEQFRAMIESERENGMDKSDFYCDFGAKVERLRCDLLALLHDLKQKGNRIAVYGASAKGSTLLNYFRIGHETLDFIVDRSTVKQGMYAPGTHLPIYPPEKLLEARPDYVLLLSWNFAQEILEQQSQFRRLGGRFIVPIPKLQVL